VRGAPQVAVPVCCEMVRDMGGRTRTGGASGGCRCDWSWHAAGRAPEGKFLCGAEGGGCSRSTEGALGAFAMALVMRWNAESEVVLSVHMHPPPLL
jgi:hypothetical protein